VTDAVGSSTAIGLIVAGFVIDVAMIALLVRRGRRGKTPERRNNAPWPPAALLVLGFVAILVGAGALR
jgi:uncharacterized membrane protein YidH (DUF202 family)